MDKHKHKTLRYRIYAKYEKGVLLPREKRDKKKKLIKLKRLKEHQDMEFAELGVDDGIVS